MSGTIFETSFKERQVLGKLDNWIKKTRYPKLNINIIISNMTL